MSISKIYTTLDVDREVKRQNKSRKVERELGGPADGLDMMAGEGGI